MGVVVPSGLYVGSLPKYTAFELYLAAEISRWFAPLSMLLQPATSENFRSHVYPKLVAVSAPLLPILPSCDLGGT